MTTFLGLPRVTPAVPATPARMTPASGYVLTPALVLHMAAALAAVAAGVVAVRSAPGGRTHRRAGKVYLAGWTLLALLGGWIGAGHPGVSPFEVMNVLGGTLVVLGYAPVVVPRLRRALSRTDRRGWLRWHLRFMVASFPFLVVAGANQVLPLLGATYSMAGFAGGTVLAAVATPLIIRRLLRRHGLLPGPRTPAAA